MSFPSFAPTPLRQRRHATRVLTLGLVALLTSGLAQAAGHAHAGHAKGVRQGAARVPTTSGPLYGDSARMQALVQSIAQSQGLPEIWVRDQLRQAHRLNDVPQRILPPSVPTAKNWQAYRDRFIEPRRIEAGVNFWNTYREALERAEAQYGVPPEIVVGILGVETFYGQHMGSHRVLDALTTLTLDFPAAHPRAAERQAFFQNELGAFLTLVHRNEAVRDTRGSFAGAMGWPQFMPSSQMRFAVDFDGDGRIDLIRSPVDAIGSVAHYFQAFGWQTGQPTHYPVRFDDTRLDKDALLAPDILPTFSVANFQAKGALLDADGQKHAGPLALIELFNGDAPPSYVAGTENFYVITRYNWSSYYAMAVIGLGREVKGQVGR